MLVFCHASLTTLAMARDFQTRIRFFLTHPFIQWGVFFLKKRNLPISLTSLASHRWKWKVSWKRYHRVGGGIPNHLKSRSPAAAPFFFFLLIFSPLLNHSHPLPFPLRREPQITLHHHIKEKMRGRWIEGERGGEKGGGAECQGGGSTKAGVKERERRRGGGWGWGRWRKEGALES